jgi:hypothetical protein
MHRSSGSRSNRLEEYLDSITGGFGTTHHDAAIALLSPSPPARPLDFIPATPINYPNWNSDDEEERKSTRTNSPSIVS